MGNFSYTFTTELQQKLVELDKPITHSIRNILSNHYNIVNNTKSARGTDDCIRSTIINEANILGIISEDCAENIIRQYFSMPLIVPRKSHKRKKRISDISDKIEVVKSEFDIETELSRKPKHYRKLINITHCIRCGYNEFKSCLHVHHVDCDHTNDDPSNLIVLCACCHYGLHNNEWNIIEINHLIAKQAVVTDNIILVPATPKSLDKIVKIYTCEKCGINSTQLVNVYHRIESQRIKQNTIIELCKNCATLANFGEWNVNDIKDLNYNPRREKKYYPKDFTHVLCIDKPKHTTTIQKEVGCDFDVAARWLKKLAETNIVIETDKGWILA